MSTLFLFVGMLCFGWSNCLWRPLQEKSTAQQLIFLRSLWTVPLIALAGWTVGGGFTTQSLHQATESIPFILLSLAGLWSFVRSTRHQPSGISGSLILYMGFFGSFVAWWFAGDHMPAYFGYTALLYIGGLFLISPDTFRIDPTRRGTVLALLAALCWAFANLGIKAGIEKAGVWHLSLIQESTVLVAGGLLHLTTQSGRSSERMVTKKGNILLAVFPLGLLTIGGVIFTNAALGEIPVLHFALITMVQPVTTLFISAAIYGEKLSLRQWAGGLLLMAGSVLCSLK